MTTASTVTYERFGRRLAADGHVVHALDTTPDRTAQEVLTKAAAAAGPRVGRRDDCRARPSACCTRACTTC